MGKKLPYQFDITIEKLLPSGEGLAHYEKWPIFAYGVLPGEKVRVQPAKKRKRSFKVIPLEILESSKDRRPPKDHHFLSTSTYQIMPESLQRDYKQSFALEIFQENKVSIPISKPEIVTSELPWNYRNKMEFCFSKDAKGELTLAFHVRHRRSHFHTVSDCAIAHQKINKAAQGIIQKLREMNISLDSLKSLIVRYSYFQDRCLAILYVKDPEFSAFQPDLEDLSGFLIVYSDPKSPASITTKILHQVGDDFLIEKVGDIQLKYYYDSFFQAQPPLFEKLLEYIRENLTEGKTLLDLYSGVGTIGLSLANKFEKVICLEFHEKAHEAALENIKQNRLENISCIQGLSEKQDLPRLLERTDTLIVDPPRCGLHPKVTKQILKTPPASLIYVSCNPNTQAQDFAILQQRFQITSWKLFDLYPQTPHMESVLIANRIPSGE